MALTLKFDIADVNGLQVALDNKQDKGTAGSTYTLPIATPTTLGGVKVDGTTIKINNGVISATQSGGGTDSPLLNLPDQTWWKTFRPTSYGTVYSNGSKQGAWKIGGYRINSGVNFATADRPDTVFTIAAYNILLPNGSREFPEEAAWDETVETHYDNSGFKPYGDFEWHKRVYSTDGVEHRLHSIYVNKTNGASRQDFEANTFTFMKTMGPGKNPSAMAYIDDGNIGLQATAIGRLCGFVSYDYDATKLGIWQVGGVGFIKIPGVFDLDGYQPIFVDNAAAKAAGRKVGQNYYTRINGVKVLAQVE